MGGRPPPGQHTATSVTPRKVSLTPMPLYSIWGTMQHCTRHSRQHLLPQPGTSLTTAILPTQSLGSPKNGLDRPADRNE